MTNFTKLTRWDADYYKSLTDDECIVCLTEREVYLLNEAIRAIRWSGTRWIGNIIGLDFDEIASNLQYRLDERMTCQNISDLLQKITQLETKIDYIFNETVINEGDTIITPETSPYDLYTPEELDEQFSIATDGCDTPDKDALFAGIREFVDYVHKSNIDALENIGQASGVAEQAGRLISAMPLFGLLPFDEVADYTAFLMTELLDEYEATVDEALLESVTCDLFCRAVASNCTFNFSDAVNYFGSKLGTTLFDLYDDLASVVQFALTGTFSGDDYFYFMCTFQFIAVAVADHFFNVHGIDKYMIEVAAGMNSPDNDWTLLCDACPTFYWYLSLDFANGQQGTSLLAGNAGVFEDGAWVVRGSPNANVFFERVIDSVPRSIAKVRTTADRLGSQGSGTFDYHREHTSPSGTLGGTYSQIHNSNFLGDGTPVVTASGTIADTTPLVKSMLWGIAVAGAYNAATRYAKCRKVEIWGYDNGDGKPTGSVWVTALP